MKVIINHDNNNKLIDDYLSFNQVPFDQVDLYDPTIDAHGRYNLNDLLVFDEPILLIITSRLFNDICSWQQSKNQLIELCNRSSKIWVWNDMDSTRELINLNHYINSDAVTWFLDAPLVHNTFAKKLNKVQFQIFPNSYFLSQKTFTRITGATIKKHNCQKQFLLTTIKKSESEHRDHLWKELQSRPGLIDQGYAFFKTRNDPWVGRIVNDWPGYPSMDFYKDAWVEIVPETFYKDALFITEKTVKPILTKTPFLMLSTPGYLNYLKEKGFQTFDHLIDESYNQQDNIEDQAKLLVDQLVSIVNNGAEEFYYACDSILEHNQQRLFEIVGGWQYHMDCFIQKNLQQLGIG